MLTPHARPALANQPCIILGVSLIFSHLQLSPLAFGQLSAGSRGFLPTALLIELLYIEGSSKATWKKKGKSPK